MRRRQPRRRASSCATSELNRWRLAVRPVVVPRRSTPDPGVVWARALAHAAGHSPTGFDVTRELPCLPCAIATGTASRNASSSARSTTRPWTSPSRPQTDASPVTRCTGSTRRPRSDSSNPSEVEDEFQRRGPTRATLTAGIDRRVAYGVQRVKISYETEAAGALELSLGFRRTSTATWYRAPFA
jgi:hypothetical protein